MRFLLMTLLAVASFVHAREPVDGYWNDVNVPSTGYLFESQNNNLVIYMFTWSEQYATQNNNWYVLQGRVDELPNMTLYNFPEKNIGLREEIGPVTVDLTDREHATITWPAGFTGHPNATAELQSYWFVGNNPRSLSFEESKRIAWSGTWMVNVYFSPEANQSYLVELASPIANASEYAGIDANILLGSVDNGAGTATLGLYGDEALMLIQYPEYRVWVRLAAGKKSGFGSAAITEVDATPSAEDYSGLSSAVQFTSYNKDTNQPYLR